jgi:hypothetical protein
MNIHSDTLGAHNHANHTHKSSKSIGPKTRSSNAATTRSLYS